MASGGVRDEKQAELRQRQAGEKGNESQREGRKEGESVNGNAEKGSSLASSFALPLLLLLGIAALFVIKTQFMGTQAVFTLEELSRHDGEADPRLYLAIVGKVFDVSRGSKHYNEKTGYDFFLSKDASRSFATGVFQHQDGVIPHRLDDLTDEQLGQVDGWFQFYTGGQHNYKYLGKLNTGDQYSIYDQRGELTPYGSQIMARLEKQREKKQKLEEETKKFPACRTKWTQELGGAASCKDGRVPRIGSLVDTAAERCACYDPVFAAQHPDKLKVLDGCDPKATMCKTPKKNKNKNKNKNKSSRHVHGHP